MTTGVEDVLLYGVPAYIAALGGAAAAVISALNKRELRTPSGPSIGEQVERSHLTAIANNMLLSRKNGPTKPIDPEAVKDEHPPPPQVPQES